MSAKSEVRDYLMQGHSITPIEALDKFGSFRLASIICDLRKEGERIITDDFRYVTRNGTKKKVAKYRMVKI